MLNDLPASLALVDRMSLVHEVVGVLASLTGASPSPSGSVLKAPPPDAYQTVGAIAAIVLALAAGILAYRVIRGGRGL